MDKYGTVELFCSLPNGIELLLVQIPLVDVRAYLNALEVQVAHASRHLLGGQVRRLHGQRAEAVERLVGRLLVEVLLMLLLLRVLANLQSQIVVEHTTQIGRVLRLRPVVEHHRHGGQHLHVHVGPLHVATPFRVLTCLLSF